MKSRVLLALSLLIVLTAFLSPVVAATADRPNVIILLTDDQGYGEVAAHGNPVIDTPNIDKLWSDSVRLTDFHVDPTCSPTRSALMTGRYSTRTGVWHTINGRSMMDTSEQTIAEVFKANGYRTGMFGKWHLGDNYPCRPSDQGFDRSIRHLGGGIGNGPDYWENDYFDDTFKVDNKWQKFEGYCTDVWFREATKFVEENKDRPFFLYLATNAPHGPYFVPDSYAKPYEAKGVPPTMSRFYGMITCIDENLGRFREKLEELGISENTLLVYMTDNGTTAGWIDARSGFKYFNAGMRGWKGSQWDGGHRVPCYFHWPEGHLTGGRDVGVLSAHIDILPTLVDLLKLEKPAGGKKLDGISLVPEICQYEYVLPDRTIFAHVQRAFLPPKWENSAAMTRQWRLIDGRELYDIKKDIGQQHDVAAEHPEVVAKLRADYEKWWASMEDDMKQTVRYGLGGDENPTTLGSHDWLMPGRVQAAWHQNHIRDGSLINGPWEVTVEKPGRYAITLYRWAPYLDREMGMKSARLTIGDVDETMELEESAKCAKFIVNLKQGPSELKTYLTRPNDKESGAYYVRVEYLEP